MVLAVAQLEQAPFTDRSVHASAGTIDMHPGGREVIDPHRMLIQGRLKSSPPCVITQVSQHNFEMVVSKINAPHHLTSRDTKRPKPGGHPGFDMHQTMLP